ncbi:MAG: hypothetical protein ABIS09_09350 [Sphingomicrobium sp.]
MTVKARPSLTLGLALLVFAASVGGCDRRDQNDRDGQLASGLKSGVTNSAFGNQFDEAARADPNAEPIAVNDEDLPPVDPTKEPVPVD